MEELDRGKIFVYLVIVIFIFLALLIFPSISEKPINALDQKVSGVSSKIPLNGLVAYHPFDIDASDPSNSSEKVFGNARYFRNGKIDGAFNFDGSGDYISITNDKSIITNGEISISLWIRPSTFDFTSSTSKSYSTILSKSNLLDASKSEYRFRFYNSSNNNNRSGLITFAITNSVGGSSIVIYSKYNQSENNWIHLVAAVNNSTISLYHNSKLVSSSDLPKNLKTFSTNDPILIGTSDLTDFFNGSIDELRIYNSTITSEEVSSLYNELSKNISCYSNSDCGTLVSVNYCLFSHLCTNTIAFSCENPGTPSSRCLTGSDVECSLCLTGCSEDKCNSPNS